MTYPSRLYGRHPYTGRGLFNDIVANSRMEEPKTRRFFQKIMPGIEYSHMLKIVHRDLNVIQGGVYEGPEIDVWSSGVILYVMLCGNLPFEDEEVQMLFAKINLGNLPSYLSSEAKDLITSMLVVDPLKRITVPEIIKHPFFTTNLPRYLTSLPPPPGSVLRASSALVGLPKQLDFEMIDGLCKIEEDVVEKLAELMDGVTVDDVWACLRRDDGAQGNAVEVAYLLLRDKGRLGKDLATFVEAERDAQLAAMDPRNALSPMKSPVGAIELEENPFEAEFNAEYESNPEDELDFMSPPPPPPPKFAILSSSFPDQLPEQHHLALYVSAKRSGHKEKKQHRTERHFGIRSSTGPPMEVMLEIYQTLRTLSMEWKEEKNLGASGRSSNIERNPEMDGSRGVDLKASIYFVETRARVGDIVVLMNLQLYMVDSIKYLVDFHHKKSYRASTEPGAGRFDMAVFDPIFTQQESMSDRRSVKGDNLYLNEDDVVSPFVFMDVACKLILELAGASE
ncbi:kinase-like protein [Agrocybe pediades]|nr:kinase-like protein [Agrocybe pediades]